MRLKRPQILFVMSNRMLGEELYRQALLSKHLVPRQRINSLSMGHSKHSGRADVVLPARHKRALLPPNSSFLSHRHQDFYTYFYICAGIRQEIIGTIFTLPEYIAAFCWVYAPGGPRLLPVHQVRSKPARRMSYFVVLYVQLLLITRSARSATMKQTYVITHIAPRNEVSHIYSYTSLFFPSPIPLPLNFTMAPAEGALPDLPDPLGHPAS